MGEMFGVLLAELLKKCNYQQQKLTHVYLALKLAQNYYMEIKETR